jgi:O-antigen/teichoic acid export membrane protein
VTLKKNLVANYLGQGWSALMGIAFVPLYINYLGIEAYGLIGLFAMLLAWLLLLDMGMTPTLVREMARFTGGRQDADSIRDLLRSIEIVAVVVAGLIAAGVCLAANWLASSWLQAENLPVPLVARAFAIMGAVAALRFIEGIYRSCIVGLQRQVLFNVITSSMATLRGLGTLAILAWVSPTIQAFFIWQGLLSLATLALMAVATYSCLPCGDRGGRFSLDALRGVWRFAGGMIGINFLALLLTQIDKILLSKMLSLSEFGYYTLAAVVAGGLCILISPITQAWFPRLSQLHASADHVGMVRTFHQGAQLVTVMLGSAAVVLIVFSQNFLLLWTQDSSLTHHAAPLLSLLALGNMLNGLMWIPYQTQLAHGWTALTVRINIVAVMIIVPAILWVTPRYGAQGAAWAWVGLNAGYVLIGIHFMYRRILPTEKWRWYVQDILKPLIPAATVAALVRWAVPIPVGAVAQLGTLLLVSSLTLIAAIMAAPLVRQQLSIVAAPLFMSYHRKNLSRRL